MRLRDLGIVCGRLPTGVHNAITDVPGVRVGHTTLNHGSIRTGVTAIIPNDSLSFKQRVSAGGFTLNGAGEVSGMQQIEEWGLIETPILLTSTMQVGTCYRACVEYMAQRFPLGREEDVIIPVVGECDDSWLSEAAALPLTSAHVHGALDGAGPGPVPEGSVGAGTGMMCCDLKAGIGTASREAGGYRLGSLVLSNFGRWEELRVAGRPVGALLEDLFQGLPLRRGVAGSIIVVLATDAPLLSHQLGRLAKRAAMGVARVGSHASHGSGEIMLAFSTASTVPRKPRSRLRRVECLWDSDLDPLFQAAVESTEEAILNSLCAAEPMTGLAGHFAPALPLEKIRGAVVL